MRLESGFTVADEVGLIAVYSLVEIGRNPVRTIIDFYQLSVSGDIHGNDSSLVLSLYQRYACVGDADVMPRFSSCDFFDGAVVTFLNNLAQTDVVDDILDAISALNAAVISHFHFVLLPFFPVF